MSLFIDSILIQDLQQIDKIDNSNKDIVYINKDENDESMILSSFSEHNFMASYVLSKPYLSTWNGLKYVHSIEQGYQLYKTFQKEDTNLILLAKTPLEAKIFGTQQINLRRDWEDVKVSSMMNVCLQATLQCWDIMSYLRNCSQNVYFVDSDEKHRDSFWADYQNGQNMYGKIWTLIHRVVTKSLSCI